MSPDERAFGARMFAALSNPARLHILEHLMQGPATVNDIARTLGLKQSITSQHLAALQAAGAVVCERRGNHRIYSLRGPRIARILELVGEFYQAHLQNLRLLLQNSSQA